MEATSMILFLLGNYVKTVASKSLNNILMFVARKNIPLERWK